MVNYQLTKFNDQRINNGFKNYFLEFNWTLDFEH